MTDIVQPKNITTGPVPDHSHSGSGSGITQLTGDVTAGPGSGSQVATIPPDTVTFAKMQNINTGKLLGRTTAGPGDTEEISVGTGLSLAAGTLSSTVAGGITQLTGDVTAGPGSGSVAATIANNAVTYAKMQDVSAASRLIGRGSAAGSGDPEELSVGTGLGISGTVLSNTGVTSVNGQTGAVTISGGGGGGSSNLAGVDFAYFIGSMGA